MGISQTCDFQDLVLTTNDQIPIKTKEICCVRISVKTHCFRWNKSCADWEILVHQSIAAFLTASPNLHIYDKIAHDKSAIFTHSLFVQQSITAHQC